MAIRPFVISERITRRESESFKKYLVEVDRIERLTTDEEYEVAMKAYSGDEKAREELITKNLRFVISVAKQYAGTNGARLEDLVNEGNIGLVKAAERFDPTQGFKFISYAVWWIRRCIMEYLTKCSRTIRIPSNKATIISKLDEVASELEQTLERPAEKDDIVEIVNGEFTDKEIDFFMSLDKTNTLSLDRKFSDDSESDLKDTLESDAFPRADHLTVESDNNFYGEALLGLLPKQMQKTVITMLFGLNGEEPLTLKETAEELEISRERVRQIRDQAIRIMRAKTTHRNIRHMLDK